MFGYVRPLASELKVREYELYKSAYCTLCHTLKKHFGSPARMILNFDFTFLAMLISEDKGDTCFCKKSCIVSPVKKKNVIASPPDGFVKSAGYGVILAYWKIIDSLSDEKGIKRIKALAAKAFLKRSYKKASAMFPEFEKAVRCGITDLSELEKSAEVSMDKMADKFAAILASAADDRILREILYHTGRWIYILDAYNDIGEDIDSGSYNPIVRKYNIRKTDDFDDSIRQNIELTLSHSIGRICSAFELLDENMWSGIIRNIIYLGMQDVYEKVKAGDYIPEENIR